MGQHRQGHAVTAVIRARIRVLRGAGQADADRSVEHAVAVAAVVQDGDTEVGLGHVDEPVGAHFELGGVPRVRRMGRAGDRAELHIAARGVGSHVEGEGHRQQMLVVVPVELDVHEERRAARREFVGDGARRRPERAPNGDAPDERSGIGDLDGHVVRVGERHGAGPRPRLEIPRVVLDRMIGRQLQNGPERARWEHLAGPHEIDDRAQVAGVVPPHREARVRHRRVGNTTRSAIERDSNAATPSAGTDATTAS